MVDAQPVIFLGSVFKALKDVRGEVAEALVAAGYTVRGMEDFPSSNDSPFEYCRRAAAEADVYVLILCEEYGTVHPQEGISFTEAEYHACLQEGTPVVAVVYEGPLQIQPDDASRRRAERFTKRVRAHHQVRYRSCETAAEISATVIEALGSLPKGRVPAFSLPAISRVIGDREAEVLRTNPMTIVAMDIETAGKVLDFPAAGPASVTLKKALAVNDLLKGMGIPNYQYFNSIRASRTLGWDDVVAARAAMVGTPVALLVVMGLVDEHAVAVLENLPLEAERRLLFSLPGSDASDQLADWEVIEVSPEMFHECGMVKVLADEIKIAVDDRVLHVLMAAAA